MPRKKPTRDPDESAEEFLARLDAYNTYNTSKVNRSRMKKREGGNSGGNRGNTPAADTHSFSGGNTGGYTGGNKNSNSLNSGDILGVTPGVTAFGVAAGVTPPLSRREREGGNTGTADRRVTPSVTPSVTPTTDPAIERDPRESHQRLATVLPLRRTPSWEAEEGLVADGGAEPDRVSDVGGNNRGNRGNMPPRGRGGNSGGNRGNTGGNSAHEETFTERSKREYERAMADDRPNTSDESTTRGRTPTPAPNAPSLRDLEQRVGDLELLLAAEHDQRVRLQALLEDVLRKMEAPMVPELSVSGDPVVLALPAPEPDPPLAQAPALPPSVPEVPSTLAKLWEVLRATQGPHLAWPLSDEDSVALEELHVVAAELSYSKDEALTLVAQWVLALAFDRDGDAPRRPRQALKRIVEYGYNLTEARSDPSKLWTPDRVESEWANVCEGIEAI